MTKCLTKQKKALSGKRNSTPFSVGGLLWLFSRLAFWNPADKLLLSMDPTDWRTERDPKNEETNSALWEWWGRFCLELDSCSSTSCSHPPLPSTTTTTTLPLHMLTGHMLIQLVNMTVNAPIEKKRLLQNRAPLCYRQFGLSQAGCLRPCLCVNCRLIWQALSCTSSIPTQQHSQIELALDSEWSERLNWTKRGEKQ